MAGVFQNIDPASPSPPAECLPPPLVRGEDTLARRRGGWGVNILEDVRHSSVLYYSTYISTLCSPLSPKNTPRCTSITAIFLITLRLIRQSLSTIFHHSPLYSSIILCYVPPPLSVLFFHDSLLCVPSLTVI